MILPGATAYAMLAQAVESARRHFNEYGGRLL